MQASRECDGMTIDKPEPHKHNGDVAYAFRVSILCMLLDFVMIKRLIMQVHVDGTSESIATYSCFFYGFKKAYVYMHEYSPHCSFKCGMGCTMGNAKGKM